MINVTGSGFISENQYQKYQNLFSPKVQQIFYNPHGGMVYEYNELLPNGNYVRKFAIATFIGFTTTADSLQEAAEVVASKVNELERLGFLKGCLAPLISMEFAREILVDLSGGKTDNTYEGKTKIAIMSFIFVTDEGNDWLNKNVPHLIFKEGGVPNMLVD